MKQELEALKNKFSGKTVSVIGIGVSNTPLIKLLAGMGIKVIARDRRELSDEITKELTGLDVEIITGDDYLKNIQEDYIFKTPGIRFDVTEIAEAVRNGSVLTSEMEEFFAHCAAPIIAVTGSDGKTTTTTLIYTMLKKQGYKCWLGGNIGTPLLDKIGEISSDDKVVVELSSFQLHTMKQSPKVAVITNLSPNHLDYHTSMDEYLDAKLNIVKYQDSDCRFVTNWDNEITKTIKSNAETYHFSRRSVPEKGVYLDGTAVMSNIEDTITVMDISDIRLPGMHNVENYMTAISAVWGMVDIDTIVDTARTFNGVEHRIEFVRELGGVKYYNDSIASSPTRAKAGLYSFDKKVILIAGGYDKHIPYDDFGYDIVERVKALILMGQTADAIEQAVIKASSDTGKQVNIYRCSDMADSVNKAYEIAREGDIVTMSPASASFDMFKNFAERGNIYKKLVTEL